MSDPQQPGTGGAAPQPTPAGWYDDGTGTGTNRYWDGTAWTEHTAPAAPAAPAAAAVPAAPVAPAAPSAPTSATMPYGPGPASTGGTTPPYGAASSATTVGYASPDLPPGSGQGPPAAGSKKLHPLGIVALVVAAVGFIFACIPGVFIVGWVLLPIGLILGIVSLFLPGAKWPGIVAIVAAVVGTIVGVVVFVVFTLAAVDDAIQDLDLPSATEVLPEASEEAQVSEEPEAPPAAETLAFGQTMGWEDGVELTVGEPQPYQPTDTAAGADQAANLLFTITLVNNSTENLQPGVFSRLSSGGQEASRIVDFGGPAGDVGIPPSTVILPGESVTWNEAWSVADPASLTMQLAPNFEYEDAIFTNTR